VTSDNDPAPTRPVRPDSDACCQNGCAPCIFELYAEAMECYQRELKAWEERTCRHGKTAGKPDAG